MPVTSTVVSIFLASPADVSSDRDIVDRTIYEWNNKNGRHTGVFFDLIRWETSISAGFGSDGQDVINSQNINYDALICLFWKRIGSSTPRAISGTVEEYELALKRRAAGENVEISIYFKTEPYLPAAQDVEQITLLEKFKADCHDAGALSGSYADRERLASHIDLLLDRLARQFGESRHLVSSSYSSSTAITINKHLPGANPKSEDDEPGFLDAVEAVESASAEVTNVLNEQSSDLDAYTEFMKRSTQELSELNTSSDGNASAKKAVINGVAEELSRLSNTMDSRNERFESSQLKMLSNLRAMVNLSYDYIDDQDYDWNSLEDLNVSVGELNDSMIENNISILDLIESVESMPRSTTEFNKSRRKFISTAKTYVSIVERGVEMTDDVLKELGTLLARK